MAGRRGQNEGSIYWDEQRERWRAAITVDGRRKYFSGRTKREVQTQMQDALHAAQQGMLPTGPRQTVAQYLASWLKASEPRVRLRTLQRYQRDVNLHITPVLGKHPLDKLTAQRVQEFYAEKLNSGLSARSVGHIHRVLHKALKDATRLGLIPRNVADLVSPPRIMRPEMRWLCPEEAKRLLEAARGDRFEALYVLALTTGMRQGELLGLKWDCVHLDIGVLDVTRSVFWLSGHGAVWSDPKSATSRRRIALAPIAVEALQHHRERQEIERRVAGDKWEEQNIVFPNTKGGPMDACNLLHHQFHPLLEKAELPKIRFHDLRHSTASLLLSLGVHPKIVASLLGHSSILITMDTYSHVLPTIQDEAVAKLGDLLTQKPDDTAHPA